MKIRMPILELLPKYQLSWLVPDFVAGATVWGVIIPLAMAYAGLVGVDPIVGISTLPLALLGYAAFGGSRFHVTGADAGVSVLAGATVASIAVGEEVLALAVALALTVGLVYVLFSLLKMGWISDLIPDPVLKGFTEGIVWVTLLAKQNRVWQPVTAKWFAVLFGAAVAYTAVRYHLLKGVEWSHFPLFILNKAVSLAAVFFVACSYLVGRTLKWHNDDPQIRLVVVKFCGLMGLSLAGIHAVMALGLWTPHYYPPTPWKAAD